jgi:hypothetical protein
MQHPLPRPIHAPVLNGRVGQVQHAPSKPVVHIFCDRHKQKPELQDILSSPDGQHAIALIQSGQARCVLIHTQIPDLPVVSIRTIHNGIIVIGPDLTSKQTSAVFARH